MREQLHSHCGEEPRVTVFWSCGQQIFCTTGRIVALFDDVLVVVGFTPTARESLSGQGGEDCNALELPTFINLERVCALVAGVPHCREACLPRCCSCHRRGDSYDMDQGQPEGA